METSRHVRTRSVCREIYAGVRRHIEDGYGRLRPPDTPGIDAATKFVVIHLYGEIAVISRVGWDNSDVVRQYRISATGDVRRQLVDVGDTRSAVPSLSDWLWLKMPLTLVRLLYLALPMQGGYYSPRQHRSRIDSEAA